MEAVVGILLLVAVGAGWILGVVAFFLVLRGRRRRRTLRNEITTLRDRLSRIEEPPARPERPAEEEPEAAPAGPPEEPAEEVVPLGADETAEERAEPEPPAEVPGTGTGREWLEEFEERLGTRWLTWAGVVVLLVGAGFFLKYAFEREWIGPTARVVLGILSGIGLLIGGDRAVRRGMGPLGQGLIGGGLALLYLSLFASFSLYDLLPRPAAFGAMVLVTAAGVTLSVLHDALPVSFLAVLGGLLTPVLLSTGENSRDALFGYLAVLDAGVLGVALFKHWRALDILAFAGTAILFTAWYAEFYTPEQMGPTLGWLAVFYVIFLLVPFVIHLRTRAPIPLERFVLALANASLAFVAAYLILYEQHEQALGFVALGMGACYAALGVHSRKRIPGDARALFGFVGLAVVFVTLAVPLHLGLHGITLAWAAEGPVLIYLGYRYRYEPVRLVGLGALLLACIRMFAAHWPLHEMLFRPFLNTSFGSAISVPVAAGVAALVHQRWAEEGNQRDRIGKLLAALGGAFLGLVLVHAELGGWLVRTDRAYVAEAAVTALWAFGAAGYLLAGVLTGSAPTRLGGLLPLAIALVLTAGLYSGDVPGLYVPVANVRFLAGLLAILAVFAYPFVLLRRELLGKTERAATQMVFWVGVLALLLLLTAEAHSYCLETIQPHSTARWSGLMSVSVVWGIYAVALLAVGFRRRFRALRLAGLGLFGATALKLVLVDIAWVKQVYRIVAFVALGLLMIGAAYLYARFEKYVLALAGEEQ